MIKATLKFRGQFVREYEVDKGTVIIGREPGVDIKVENKGVLPKHCKISKRGQKYILEDLGTPEGVELNGEKIRMAQIKKGDALALGGNFSLEFDFTSSPPQAPSANMGATIPFDKDVTSQVKEAEQKKRQRQRQKRKKKGDSQKDSTQKNKSRGLVIDKKPPVPPGATKSEDFYSNATMKVSAVEDDFQAPQPKGIDMEIQPLSLDDLGDLSIDSPQGDWVEKINGILMTLEEKELEKVFKILTVLYD